MHASLVIFKFKLALTNGILRELAWLSGDNDFGTFRKCL